MSYMSAEREVKVLRDYCSKVEAERDALAKFKAFVHARLDQAGVPADPPGDHRDRGCRVGQRLAWCEQAMANANPFRALQASAFERATKDANDATVRAERAESHLAAVRSMLRIECAEVDANDWPDDLHLADVIEKYLCRALHRLLDKYRPAAIAAEATVADGLDGLPESVRETMRRDRAAAETAKYGAVKP